MPEKTEPKEIDEKLEGQKQEASAGTYDPISPPYFYPWMFGERLVHPGQQRFRGMTYPSNLFVIGPTGEIVPTYEAEANAQVEEVSKLSTRIEEVLRDANLSRERIAKDQEQISALMNETRTLLNQLRS